MRAIGEGLLAPRGVPNPLRWTRSTITILVMLSLRRTCGHVVALEGVELLHPFADEHRQRRGGLLLRHAAQGFLARAGQTRVTDREQGRE